MRMRQKSEPDKKLRALFFCSNEAQTNDNYQRIPKAFEVAGWEVVIKTHSSLTIANLAVKAGEYSVEDFDLIWPIGFGQRASFLDRLQILSACTPSKLITSLDSWLMCHGKAKWLKFCALSIVASEPDILIEFMEQHGGKWVLKPNAGSYARDIFFIHEPEQGAQQIKQTCSAGREFFILQRFLPEIREGELRCICVDGQIIGKYLKVPNDDFKANIFEGASIEKATISKNQEKLIKTISHDLTEHKIGFAAIDMVGTTLMEVNIANPGGLESLQKLYHRDFSEDLVSKISDRYA